MYALPVRGSAHFIACLRVCRRQTSLRGTAQLQSRSTIVLCAQTQDTLYFAWLLCFFPFHGSTLFSCAVPHARTRTSANLAASSCGFPGALGGSCGAFSLSTLFAGGVESRNRGKAATKKRVVIQRCGWRVAAAEATTVKSRVVCAGLLPRLKRFTTYFVYISALGDVVVSARTIWNPLRSFSKKQNR